MGNQKLGGDDGTGGEVIWVGALIEGKTKIGRRVIGVFDIEFVEIGAIFVFDDGDVEMGACGVGGVSGIVADIAQQGASGDECFGGAGGKFF